MSTGEQVLVVDQAAGTLEGVMAELDQLGFRVVWVPTFRGALDFVRACPQLALVIASAAAAQDGGDEFLAQAKDIRPSLRVIWGTGSRPRPKQSRGQSPDSLIPEPFRPDALRETIATLLTEHFYPDAVADAVRSAALEVLGTLGEFRLAGGAFLVANRTALSDFSSIIAFSGEASGHLMASMNADHVRLLQRRFSPTSRSLTLDSQEDFVGELCNRILGRINAVYAAHGISVFQTTPIFIRAAGSSMRYPGRHPSFGCELTDGRASVSLEYYLADVNRAKLETSPTSTALEMGEIRFL